MTNDYLIVLRLVIAGLVGITAYCLLIRRLADFVQPLRLRMASLGETILASRPSGERASQIEFYLDHAFNGKIMFVAMLLLPFSALISVWKDLAAGFRLSQPQNPDDFKLTLMFFASTLAANPVCGAVVLLEILVLLLISVAANSPRALMTALSAAIRAEARLLSFRFP